MKTFTDLKRERLIAQEGVIRCDCGWVFDGLLLDGIKAAQAHRREAHPDRPEQSPSKRHQRRPSRRPSAAKQRAEAEAKQREREEEEWRERFADLLRERGPLTVREIRDAVAFEDSVYRVRVQLGRALRAGIIEMAKVEKEPYWFLLGQEPPLSKKQRKAEVIRELLRERGPLSAREVAALAPVEFGEGDDISRARRVGQVAKGMSGVLRQSDGRWTPTEEEGSKAP